MHLLRLYCLRCSAISVTAANSPNYETASASAAHKGVQLRVGHHYASYSDDKDRHVLLIVGAVFPMLNGLDFWANSYEMALTNRGKYGRLYHGASVVAWSEEGWDCTKAKNFRHKGEAEEYTRADIMENGKRRVHSGLIFADDSSKTGYHILDRHNAKYNIVTNNCKTFVWELLRQIKIRSRHRRMASSLDGASDSERELGRQ